MKFDLLLVSCGVIMKKSHSIFKECDFLYAEFGFL